MKALGRHLLVEYHGCDRGLLTDLDRMEACLKRAAVESGATIVQSVFHLFNPHGVSGVVVIAESHLAVHTWPEYGYVAADIFTCGEDVDPWKAHAYLREALGAVEVFTSELKRGRIEQARGGEVSFRPPAEIHHGRWPAREGERPDAHATLFRTPTKYFLVSGAAEGPTSLNAFDMALVRAGVGNTNLVKMSSILPPGCEEVRGVKLPQGALVPVAYASRTSEVPGERIAAAVAVAIPENPLQAGLIMEHSAAGGREEAEATVRRMAEDGMRARGEAVRYVQSASVDHEVFSTGAVFAGVVLWD